MSATAEIGRVAAGAVSGDVKLVPVVVMLSAALTL